MLVPEVNGPGFYGDYSPSYPRPTAIFSHNPLNWARLDQESIRLLVFGLTMDSWDSRSSADFLSGASNRMSGETKGVTSPLKAHDWTSHTIGR